VGLLFFIAVLVIIGVMQDRNLHPMHYFFTAAAFFAFHLLFSYLADQIALEQTFLVAAAVSVLLVTSYVVRVLGPAFTFKVVLPSQVLFLVLFSYAFFFLGYTGLTITVGSIITLAILMHVTAKVKWDDKLTGPPKRPVPPAALPAPPAPPPAGGQAG
jgi:inner membrane protein involved in colicin E2 resistance